MTRLTMWSFITDMYKTPNAVYNVEMIQLVDDDMHISKRHTSPQIKRNQIDKIYST